MMEGLDSKLMLLTGEDVTPSKPGDLVEDNERMRTSAVSEVREFSQVAEHNGKLGRLLTNDAEREDASE